MNKFQAFIRSIKLSNLTPPTASVARRQINDLDSTDDERRQLIADLNYFVAEGFFAETDHKPSIGRVRYCENPSNPAGIKLLRQIRRMSRPAIPNRGLSVMDRNRLQSAQGLNQPARTVNGARLRENAGSRIPTVYEYNLALFEDRISGTPINA